MLSSRAGTFGERRVPPGTPESLLAFASGSLECPVDLSQRRKAMWIVLFSIATAAAIGLSVAAIMLQARKDILRG